MAIVLDSLQRLPDGTDLIRYHLLDDNYQLIKPVERFLRFKQLAGAAIGTIKTYAEKLKAFWQYLDLKQMDWQDLTEKHLAEFGYWYLTGGILLDGRSLPDEDELQSARSRKTVNLAITAIVQFYDFHATNGNVEDKNLREYKLPRRTQQRGRVIAAIL
jgi:site-specific recombinase XerD